MEPQAALDIGRQTLMLTLMLCLPLLCVGMIVGVIISILQAVTQIQEMTLTFVPKIIATALAAIFFMPWILDQMTSFTLEMLGPMVVP